MQNCFNKVTFAGGHDEYLQVAIVTHITGAILLDDGTILQQEEPQDGQTDLLLYVLTTSETQGDE